MSGNPSDLWLECNQQALVEALTRVRHALECHLAHAEGREEPPPPPPVEEEAPVASALETLCQSCHLSSFERDILILCAGMELDSGFAALCAAAQGDAQRSWPTFSLALAALP